MNNDERIDKLRKPVVKANELITKSRFDLTLQQQKMVLYIISQVNPFDNDFKLYEFNIREFCKLCGIETNGTQYEELKAQIKAIADQSVWVELENEEETTLRWIEKPYINKRSGKIKIRLDKDMKPFLLELNRNFTTHELIYAMNFKSKYSVRLYEYIKARHFDENIEYTFEISVEELKQRMGAEKYKAFCDFNSRALKPAVKEINTHSDKDLNIEYIKKGKTIISLRITIRTHLAVEMLQIQRNIEKSLDLEQMTLFDLF